MTPTFVLLAIAAGGLTVLSPCILPILPILLGASAGEDLRHRPFWIVLGLSASFALFGAVFAVFGSLLGLSNALLRDAALVLLFLFGLSLLWPGPWERLGGWIGAWAQGIPGTGRGGAGKGRGGAILLGASLGLVWAPCAGPILGIILTLAAVQGDFARSLLLMAGYSLGAAVPMLAIGYGGRRLYARIASVGRWGALSRKALGALTIATVVAISFGLDTALLARLPAALFPANDLEQRLARARGDRGAPVGGADLARNPEDAPLPVLGTMPEFTEITAWLNSPPLTAAGLRGKVVLVDFWTYSCINCIRTFPYLKRWYDQYRSDGFVIVGVHTPEFAFEKDLANVEKAVARFGITYPVALDDRYGTWRAYDNEAWPAHYLFDARGRLREVRIGEGGYAETERSIQALLTEARGLSLPGAVEELPANVDFSLIESPETYVGYARAQHFSSPEPMARGRTVTYSAPARLGLNDWALRGRWRVSPEEAALAAPGGEILFRFKAPRLNLVMSAPAAPVRAEVLLDGMPIPAALRGADVAPDGTVTIGFSRLYNLVSLPPGERRDHVFGLHFPVGGVHLYAFTFG